jgi:metal-responsive CopG/Arc/MetJ family transcriptional regulator
MRILVDIPDAELEALNAIGARERRSRASLIREAIAAYVAERHCETAEAFGLWGKRKIDGLEYQEKVRAEW